MKDFSKFVLETLKTYGNREAIRSSGKSVSYDEILNEIYKFSNGLNKIGVKSVALCIDNKMDLLIVALSCIVVKVPFIVIDRNNPSLFLESILKEAKINVLISDGIFKLDNCYIVDYRTMSVEQELIKEDVSSPHEDVLFYIATSGSSGKPKVAERIIGAFYQDYIEFYNNYSYLFGKIALQYAKLNFSYGLENSLLLLIGGTTICFGKNSLRVTDLELMYEEIEKNQASIVFWASPIIKLLSKHYKLFLGMPSCIKYIYTGGEPLVISADMIVELHNRNITLINDYGCSELGKVFSYPYQVNLRDMEQYNVVGIGSPLKGYEAVILDEDYNPTDEGYLVLKSKNKFLCRYVDSSIETNQRYIDGYWYYNMHDIAKIVNRNLIVLGREINSVNVAGYRVELEQVENAINQITQIDTCIVIAEYNRYREASLFCFYSGKILSRDVRLKLGDKIPSYMIPNAFTNVKDIYLLPNGKVDRKKNIEELEKKLHHESQTSNDLKYRIYEYLSRIVGTHIGSIEDIYFQPFSDYGMDSLNIVDFLSTVEEKEKVLLNIDEIGTSMKCLKDVVDMVYSARKDFQNEI